MQEERKKGIKCLYIRDGKGERKTRKEEKNYANELSNRLAGEEEEI